MTTREHRNGKKGAVRLQTAGSAAANGPEFEVSGSVRVTVVTYVRATSAEEAVRVAKTRDIQLPGCAACSKASLEDALLGHWVVADKFLGEVEEPRAELAEAL